MRSITLMSLEIHCSKYLQEHLLISIGDNVKPCPIDKPYISLDSNVETLFLLISLQVDRKKVLTKQSLIKFMVQIL